LAEELAPKTSKRYDDSAEGWTGRDEPPIQSTRRAGPIKKIAEATALKASKNYQKTRQRKATKERRLAVIGNAAWTHGA